MAKRTLLFVNASKRNANVLIQDDILSVQLVDEATIVLVVAHRIADAHDAGLHLVAFDRDSKLDLREVKL